MANSQEGVEEADGGRGAGGDEFDDYAEELETSDVEALGQHGL